MSHADAHGRFMGPTLVTATFTLIKAAQRLHPDVQKYENSGQKEIKSSKNDLSDKVFTKDL